MAKRDYYEILGVAKDASKDDIKRAYRRVAVTNHPDKNPGDHKAEERFKEATEAYEILADEQKRQAYDQYGFAGIEGMGGSGDFSHVVHDFGDIFGNFGDLGGIFGSLFGGGRRTRGGDKRQSRGADLRYDIEISFNEMVSGVKHEVSYRRHTSCERCGGSGGEKGAGKRSCNYCNGTGQLRHSVGFFSMASTCEYCGGTGTRIDKPCRNCNGKGIEEQKQHLRVSIPPGIESGNRVTIRGQGNVGSDGGIAGDLHVVVRVRPHPIFERHGDDVYCVIPVGITQATLGAALRVPTLHDRRAKVKIPAGVQHDHTLRLSGEGVPHLSNASIRGDLYIKLRIIIPSHISGRAKALLEQLAQLKPENDAPNPIPLSDL